MELAMIGLGRMGDNMAIRLIQGGHRVVAWNRTYAKTEALAKEHGAIPTKTFAEVVDQLKPPRIIWIMLPSGEVTEQALDNFLLLLSPGDIVVDGGNSNYHDSVRRAQKAADKKMHYLDCGTSGGVWGLQVGYCVMVGGEKETYDHCEPIFKTLAPPNGCAYVGASGAGHFVKMVHNGIEYGMLQAYGEGFEILHASPYKLDLHQIAVLWDQGSVVRSWLLELAADAFAKEGSDLKDIQGYIEDSGEGRWTVQQAIDTDVPAPVITLSLIERFRSREPDSFGAKVIAALRNQFGGHAVKRE
ncbi:MAG: decarboxylating 6-phosphogluconate dehydrogenase [Chloroflexi bacterium]|nr:decarboxylating 6-phosphogluconate dehydrogenase [Chloroflexota bacterium]